jgi:hypothetical protein
VTATGHEPHRASAAPPAEDADASAGHRARGVLTEPVRRPRTLAPLLLLLAVGIALLVAAFSVELGRLRWLVVAGGVAISACVAAILANRAVGRRRDEAGRKS